MARLIITKTWAPDDVLTDVTSFKFSDSTATYGIKRVGDDSVLVADNTALTKTATGTYHYDSETAGDTIPDATPIRIAFEVVYAGATYRWTEDATTAPSASADAFNYLYLRQRVGMKWKGTLTPTGADLTEVNNAILDALRMFYQERNWQFLNPSANSDTTASQAYMTLPAGFAYMLGDFRFDPSENTGRTWIKRRSPQEVAALRASTGDSTGVPEIYCIEPVAFTQAGQTYRALFYPVPDAAYTLYYRYRVSPSALSADSDVPYGPATYYPTILQACLALCEQRQGIIRGSEWVLYRGPNPDQVGGMLKTAFEHDHRDRGGIAGYNGDDSDDAPTGGRNFLMGTWTHTE